MCSWRIVFLHVAKLTCIVACSFVHHDVGHRAVACSFVSIAFRHGAATCSFDEDAFRDVALACNFVTIAFVFLLWLMVSCIVRGRPGLGGLEQKKSRQRVFFYSTPPGVVPFVL